MSNINVGLNPVNDPNYTGAVKEASRYDFNNSTKYDLLFSDLASTIKNGVEGAKAVMTNMIKEDVRYGYDKITGAQGVDTAADNPLTPLNIGKNRPGPVDTAAGPSAISGSTPAGGSPLDANKPPQAQQETFKNRVMNLQAAYAQGRIGDTYYYTQLEAMNRAIRAKYPGFRDEVDAMVQSVTGVTPANSLRKAIEHDLNAAQSGADALQKAALDFAKSNAGYLRPETIAAIQKGKVPSMGDLIAEVYPQKKEEQNISLVKARLEQRKAVNAASSEDALTTATEVLNSTDTKLWNSTSANGKSINGWLQERLTELKDNKTLTPEREAQIKAEFLQMKQGYFNGLNEIWTSPLAPGSKHTLASALSDPGKQKQFNDNAMEKFNLIDQALTNKDYGLLKQTANSIETMQNNQAKKILENYPTIAAVSAIAKQPGMASVLQNVMTQSPKDYSELQNQVSNAISIHNLTGGKYQPNGKSTPSDDLNTFAKTPGGSTPAGMNRFLKDRVNELSNPALPPEMRLEAAKKMFSQDNSQYILKWATSTSKATMFNYLTSPEVTKSMQEIGRSNPELWQNYSKWALHTFSNAFKSVFDDVNNVNFREWIDVKQDPKTGMYKVEPTEKGIAENSKYAVGVGGSIIRAIEERKNTNVSNAVEKVNSMISQISPILKANGYDVAKEIPNLARNIRIQDKKNTTLWNSLVDAASTSDEGTAIRSFGGSTPNFTKPSGSEGKKFATDKVMNYTELKTGSADVENLNKGAQKMLDGLINDGVVDKIEVKSGFRDVERNAAVGGARYSKHLEGGAVDISLKGYSDEEKAALLEAAIAHGAKGIGLYPGGTSLHIDTRDTPATWGYSPFGKYKGVHWSAQPAWAHGALKKLFKE